MSRLDKSRFPGMSFARLRKDKLSKLWSILREMSLGDFTENPTDMIVLMSNKGKSRVRFSKGEDLVIRKANQMFSGKRNLNASRKAL